MGLRWDTRVVHVTFRPLGPFSHDSQDASQLHTLVGPNIVTTFWRIRIRLNDQGWVITIIITTDMLKDEDVAYHLQGGQAEEFRSYKIEFVAGPFKHNAKVGLLLGPCMLPLLAVSGVPSLHLFAIVGRPLLLKRIFIGMHVIMQKNRDRLKVAVMIP